VSIPSKLGWLLLLAAIALPAQAARLSAKSLTLNPGESTTIKVSRVKGTPVLSDANPGIVTATLSGSELSIQAQTLGETTLSVKDDNRRDATLRIAVRPPMSLSKDFVSLGIKKSQSISIEDPAGKRLRLQNSNSKSVKARLKGKTITVTGNAEGESTLTVSDGKTTRTVVVQVVSASAFTVDSVSGNTNGRLLASNCFQCHGTYGSGGFDALRGKDDLASELNEYLSGEEDPDGIMAAHLKGYTQEQLQLIANYLANP